MPNAVTTFAAVKKIRGTPRQHGGWKAHDAGMYCLCTPEMYEPHRHAFTPSCFKRLDRSVKLAISYLYARAVATGTDHITGKTTWLNLWPSLPPDLVPGGSVHKLERIRIGHELPVPSLPKSGRALKGELFFQAPAVQNAFHHYIPALPVRA